MKNILLAVTILFATPVFAQTEKVTTAKIYQPFTYETPCALQYNDEFQVDNCKVVETREKGGALRTRNIFSNRFRLTIKSRFDKEKGFVTWDSHNKFEYKFEYKVGIVDGLGAWSYVMPGFLLQNVSWD